MVAWIDPQWITGSKAARSPAVVVTADDYGLIFYYICFLWPPSNYRRRLKALAPQFVSCYLLYMIDDFDKTYWMRMALQEAEKAYRIGEVPVGSVIVLNDQLLGRGYNQTEKLKDPTAHAEILAITSATQAIGDWRLDGAVLYSTLEPCSMCAGASVLARIGKIVFGASDPKFGACGSIFNIPVDPRLNHRIELDGGVMADEAAELMKTFFRNVRQAKGGIH